MGEKAAALAALCARLRELPRRAGGGPVCGEGDPDAALALVGEAPGETEARLGRPFVGRAGRLLDRQLAAAGLGREAVWITNVVKFRPTREGAGRPRNRPPSAAEVREGLVFLLEELEILRPRAILCLGTVAAKALTGGPFTLARERGAWRRGPAGSALAATYHPAYLLRLQGADRERALAEFQRDLEAAREAAERPGAGTNKDSPSTGRS